jgi:hypothetical protein
MYCHHSLLLLLQDVWLLLLQPLRQLQLLLRQLLLRLLCVPHWLLEP